MPKWSFIVRLSSLTLATGHNVILVATRIDTITKDEREELRKRLSEHFNIPPARIHMIKNYTREDKKSFEIDKSVCLLLEAAIDSAHQYLRNHPQFTPTTDATAPQGRGATETDASAPGTPSRTMAPISISVVHQGQTAEYRIGPSTTFGAIRTSAIRQLRLQGSPDDWTLQENVRIHALGSGSHSVRGSHLELTGPTLVGRRAHSRDV